MSKAKKAKWEWRSWIQDARMELHDYFRHIYNLNIQNISTTILWGICSKRWQVMFYFTVGGGCYRAFRTWDGDGCGVSYSVRTRLWCGVWPVAEVKTEKRQLYPAKIWYCPTGFSFYSKGHNVLYSAKSASRNSTLGKTFLDRISAILNF